MKNPYRGPDLWLESKVGIEEQCLCCKGKITQAERRFVSPDSMSHNVICIACRWEWIKLAAFGGQPLMFQLGRYKAAGRQLIRQSDKRRLHSSAIV